LNRYRSAHEFDTSGQVIGVLNLDIGAASHTGLVRERNEDSALSTSRLFVVADGMGGHAAGDVASRLAIAALARLTRPDERRDSTDDIGTDDISTDDISTAIAAANRDILEATAADGRQAGMGTTLTGFGVIGGDAAPRWVVFNVGDSRVYRFADDTLLRVTIDHSEVEELVSAGRLSAAEAKTYPRRNVVTRSLGTVPPPDADIWVLEAQAPERFLACSDGLSIELDDDQIADILRAESESQRAADRLVAAALDAGGRDNVTVIVVGNGWT
jgi:serine/threonine protein phosphatase PrpC